MTAPIPTADETFRAVLRLQIEMDTREVELALFAIYVGTEDGDPYRRDALAILEVERLTTPDLAEDIDTVAAWIGRGLDGAA